MRLSIAIGGLSLLQEGLGRRVKGRPRACEY